MGFRYPLWLFVAAVFFCSACIFWLQSGLRSIPSNSVTGTGRG